MGLGLGMGIDAVTTQCRQPGTDSPGLILMAGLDGEWIMREYPRRLYGYPLGQLGGLRDWTRWDDEAGMNMLNG